MRKKEFFLNYGIRYKFDNINCKVLSQEVNIYIYYYNIYILNSNPKDSLMPLTPFFHGYALALFFCPLLSFYPLYLRVLPHSEFRQGERGPLSRLSKGRSWWREGTASAAFASDKSTSRSAFKNVVICLCIRACTCRPRMCVQTVQERGGYRPSRPRFPRARRT